MSADTRQLAALAQQLRKAGANMNEVRREIAQKEGQSVVTRAKTICTKENIVDTGNLRNSYHAQPAVVSENSASVAVGNNMDYASHVEYGHLTGVGRGTKETLLARRKRALKAGRFVKGKYVLERAIYGTLKTQQNRIEKRLRRIYEEQYK